MLRSINKQSGESVESVQKHAFTNQKMHYNTQNKCKKTKPGLVAIYDIQPGNGGVYSQRKR